VFILLRDQSHFLINQVQIRFLLLKLFTLWLLLIDWCVAVGRHVLVNHSEVAYFFIFEHQITGRVPSELCVFHWDSKHVFLESLHEVSDSDYVFHNPIAEALLARLGDAVLTLLLAIDAWVYAGPYWTEILNFCGHGVLPLCFLFLFGLNGWEVFYHIVCFLVYWLDVFLQQIWMDLLYDLVQFWRQKCGDGFGCELVNECLHYIIIFYYKSPIKS